MKYWLILFCTILMGIKTEAQIIRINGVNATVDNQPYVKIKAFGCKGGSSACAYEVVTMNGEKICKATVKEQRVAGSKPNQPKTKYVLYEFFDAEGQNCEMPFPLSLTLHASDIIQTMLRAGIVNDDLEIDEEAINDFVDTYGQTFSTVGRKVTTDEEQEIIRDKRKTTEEEEEE